jgi:hypothetical protein
MFVGASLQLIASLSHFWPTDAGWDVQEANLVAHLFAAARAADGHAYLEVPLKVGPDTGKRLDLLILPSSYEAPVTWCEVKRIWANKDAGPVLSDLERLANPATQLGERLPNRLLNRPSRRMFIALTHEEHVAAWWRSLDGQPFNSRSRQHDVLWRRVADCLQDKPREVLTGGGGPAPRPTFILTASVLETRP